MPRHITYIVVVSIFTFIFGNWILSITSPDEGKNLDAALRMIERKDFIVPFYNCEYRFEKPPLFYWLTDVSFILFGVNEFSGRIVSGLSALGIAILTYLIGKDLLGKERALIGAIIYATLIHNWVEARAATPEMLLTFFMVLGLYLFFRERFLMGWVALGFAFLAKGPVGVLLPTAVYLLWKRNLRFINIKGILLFLLVGFSWYGAMLYKFGFSYFYKFFIYENILRYTGHKSIHPYPFWYYLPIVLASMLFYLPKLPLLLKRWDRKLNPLLLWFLFVLIFYSLARNKLHHYILFLYPPLALMLANYTGRRYVLGTLSLSSLVLLSLFLYAGKVESERFVPRAVELIRKEEPERLFFYRTENSAIVFYTRRCIEKVDRREDIPEGSFIILKEKDIERLRRVRVLLRGREFGRELALVRLE